MKLFNHTPKPLDFEAANLSLKPGEDVEVDDEKLASLKTSKPFLAALSKGQVSMRTDEHFAEIERKAAAKRAAELDAKLKAEKEAAEKNAAEKNAAEGETPEG